MAEVSKSLAEGAVPVPVAEMMAVLGQIYMAILAALILGLVSIDIAGLIEAMPILPLDDPALASNFAA